jgi:hypothetical protein
VGSGAIAIFPETVDVRLWPSDREARAALRTPALQHQPASAGGHAGAEPVCPDTLQFAGLVRSFHEEIRRKTKGWECAGGRKVKEPSRACQ